MAALAIENRVRSSQRKARYLSVWKLCAQPRVLRVAIAARRGKIQRHMIGICGAFEFRCMARRTIRQDAILAAHNGFMAGFAFDRGMSSQQRKKILVVANLLAGSEPTLHDMALGAIRAKFAQVNVGVTIRTILSHVAEDRMGMTLVAGYARVHASKRVVRLIVVEFKNGTNRGPAVGRVAILARDCQWSVRIGRSLALDVGPQNARRVERDQ
jgi:hypothetical protein